MHRNSTMGHFVPPKWLMLIHHWWQLHSIAEWILLKSASLHNSFAFFYTVQHKSTSCLTAYQCSQKFLYTFLSWNSFHLSPIQTPGRNSLWNILDELLSVLPKNKIPLRQHSRGFLCRWLWVQNDRDSHPGSAPSYLCVTGQGYITSVRPSFLFYKVWILIMLGTVLPCITTKWLRIEHIDSIW